MCYSALVKKNLSYLAKHYGVQIIRQQEDYFADEVTGSNGDLRIYPQYIAPIITLGDGKRSLEALTYGTAPPSSRNLPSHFTSFNARRDNLHSYYWSNAYKQKHGIVILKSFFEWVAVRDLLTAKCVTIDEVKVHLDQQSNERRQRVLASGKKYRPTASESKPILDRKVIIEFFPEGERDLIVPVIISRANENTGAPMGGFAIVTDEPPPEVLVAGHDRCPIFIQSTAIQDWLDIPQSGPYDGDPFTAIKTPAKLLHRLAGP